PFSARELLTRVGATIALARMRSEIQRRAAADLEAMARLRELGEMCANNGDDLARCLDSILDTAIAVSGADKGNVQLFDRESGALKIEVQRGFDRPFLEFSAIVRSGESAACGNSMRVAERTVVPDVENSQLFAGTPAQDVLLHAGVRAVQSTPLLS